MGNSRWDGASAASYSTYSSSISHTRNAREVFKAVGIKSTLDPNGVTIRESCDSQENPDSNAIIIGLDVTGSMGMIAHEIAKDGLGKLMSEIISRTPVPSPHIMFMGIGDASHDSSPLQVSQFEADITIVQQLSELYIECGGGYNDSESYDLPWYFAANHTSIDCFNKRQRKGYLFTLGDEMPPESLSGDQINSILGSTPQFDSISSKESLKQAQEKFHVFHLIIEDGSYARHHGQSVTSAWSDMLGHRALSVSNHKMVAEVIISAIQISEGKDPEAVIDSWQDEEIKKVVRRAVGD